MSTQHITPGGAAADSLREALARAKRPDQVVELRDDLAVGPLRGADELPSVRATFWQNVLGDSDIDFARELEDEAARLEALVDSDAPVVIWHGQSAANQLMLRRVAYHLRNEPQRLNEVRLSSDDLPPEARASARADSATAVGMFAPEVLLAKLADAAPISVLRIGRLALEWQEVKQVNAETRAWRDNTFKRGTFAELDALVAEHASTEWRNAARVAGELMVADVGFLVSDTIAFWRCRQAAAAGLVELSGEPDGYGSWRTLQIRATEANVKRGPARAF
ncbi:DUF1835 domain-containing protein [Trinickia fusca]|uniref:DUF1835 domain-containing protein n=1 Tax=Trinickia fusca TaxID=2419777 RepID=A0A494X234_9BURK|nr:DUF1835 domain-containing protein [Trinickia fusca]RKP44412.1 DUF1835 domain-containing protein [Trinickia fusca]